MRIKTLRVRNFRLLADVELALDDQTTLVVGRNNSGKTSLSEIARRFLGEGSPDFQFEDFSSSSYDDFTRALRAHRAGEPAGTVRTQIPAIELRLHVVYDPDLPDLGPLAPFVIDLDPDCTEVVAVIRFQVKDGEVAALFDDLGLPANDDDPVPDLFRALRARVPALFETRVRAEDPQDPSNIRPLTIDAVRSLVRTGFIHAHRGLTDVTNRESDVLGKVLEGLFSAATASAVPEDREIVEALRSALDAAQVQMDQSFGHHVKKLLPTLGDFGYPGLGGQVFHAETQLKLKKVLSNFTKIRYEGRHGVALPESYNGLGIRNLIFILLQLVGFHKQFTSDRSGSGVHLIFIEEPEAHLHPQMQEVFIKQLATLAGRLPGIEGEAWPVQFVVTTHSSHIANESRFERIRYFLSVPAPDERPGARVTKVKDLSRGLRGQPAADRDFMHQYLTLTRCDLFFADKAVLVEGLTERLLFRVIVEQLEKEDPQAPKLSTQYTTVMEVGGAHAHLFFGLLKFLELHTLIVTDLDAAGENGEKCPVHLGKRTSNASLNRWFSNEDPLTPQALLAKRGQEKCRGLMRIAFQIPEKEGDPCGRTFEDAFILANPGRYSIEGSNPGELEVAAQKEAGRHKKSKFALELAIEDTDWNAPRYIVEGVRWLATGKVEAPAVEAQESMVAAVAKPAARRRGRGKS